jgi:hypothetical protein
LCPNCRQSRSTPTGQMSADAESSTGTHLWLP